MTVEAPEERSLGEEPGLEVEFRHIGPVCLISLCGELSAGSVAVLEAQVDRLGRTSCSRVVVDMAGVTAIDTTGTKVLSGLHHYVRARGGSLDLIGTAPGVRVALVAGEVAGT